MYLEQLFLPSVTPFCEKNIPICRFHTHIGAVTKSKKSVRGTIDTFESSKKFHTIMKVLNYRFINIHHTFNTLSVRRKLRGLKLSKNV